LGGVRTEAEGVQGRQGETLADDPCWAQKVACPHSDLSPRQTPRWRSWNRGLCGDGIAPGECPRVRSLLLKLRSSRRSDLLRTDRCTPDVKLLPLRPGRSCCSRPLEHFTGRLARRGRGLLPGRPRSWKEGRVRRGSAGTRKTILRQEEQASRCRPCWWLRTVLLSPAWSVVMAGDRSKKTGRPCQP